MALRKILKVWKRKLAALRLTGWPARFIIIRYVGLKRNPRNQSSASVCLIVPFCSRTLKPGWRRKEGLCALKPVPSEIQLVTIIVAPRREGVLE